MRVAAKVAGDEEVEVRALDVLRAGVRATPELRAGLGVSILMALTMAGGKVVIPIAIQQILSKGVSDGEPDWGFILGAGAAAATAMIALAACAGYWAAQTGRPTTMWFAPSEMA